MSLRVLPSVLCAFVLLSTGAIRAAGLEDYLGRWEMLITNSGTTFRSCSLVLNKPETGPVSGEMVWRWGSVWKFDKEGVVTLSDKGELQIHRGDVDWKGPLTLRRIGDGLEGSVALKNGQSFGVIAFRGKETADPTGKWAVTLSDDEGNSMEGTLHCSVSPSGSVSAKAYGGDGNEVQLREVKLDGTTLSFRVVPDDGSDGPLVRAAVRGDRLEGSMEAPDGQYKLKLSAQRERKWGEPIHLLAQNGLAGWKPREHNPKRFGWTCKDGILSNGDKGDIDIQSVQEFGNFKLHLEYKVVEKGNSGVYLRGRYEVQILDDHKAGRVQKHGNGAVYSRVVPSAHASKPHGEWQSYDITLIDRYLTVVLNGKTIVDNVQLEGITGGAISPFEAARGPLLLQGDHGKIWFRNITVTPALDG